MQLKRLKERKDKALLPITRFLANNGIKPYQLTIIGMGFGLLAVYFIAKNTSLFALFFVIWVLMDILDGTLARHTKMISSWQDFLGDKIIFVILIAKMFLISGKAMVAIVPMLYLLVHLLYIKIKRENRHWIAHPYVVSFALLGFQQYNLAIWWIAILFGVNFIILSNIHMVKLLRIGGCKK